MNLEGKYKQIERNQETNEKPEKRCECLAECDVPTSSAEQVQVQIEFIGEICAGVQQLVVLFFNELVDLLRDLLYSIQTNEIQYQPQSGKTLVIGIILVS